MKHLLVLTIAFVASVASAGVQLKNTPTDKRVQLDSQALEVLKKWDPEFKVFDVDNYPRTVITLFKGASQELPMAILADFNGDQKQDIALMGHNKKRERIVILVADHSSYVPVEVKSRDYMDPTASFIQNQDAETESGLNIYLSLLKSKEMHFKKNQSYAFKPDALQLENFGGATSAYYLKSVGKNKFEVKEYKGMIE